ncbi:Arsenate reductase [hydrothermal vent metagenome]|uniref:Arsenate reductase n=1 Tax=hydrothermal vent metagenome TaxID=652676 RepID=A0A1W1D3A6_9ZZZZ
MDKRVLVLCTGNSCRSIIAEALINAKLDGIVADSAGVKATKKVNENAKKLLEEKGIWRDSYHSKTLDEVIDNKYDLVVTVCDHAKETCPMFPRPVPKMHMGFEDPDKKGYEAFEKTYEDISKKLLPAIEKALKDDDVEACHTMANGEILNEKHLEYPLFHAVLYGDRVLSAKFSKRLSCAIKHLPLRVEFRYEYDTLKAVEKGIVKDPTLVLEDEIFLEGLVQAEEITKSFEDFLKRKQK